MRPALLLLAGTILKTRALVTGGVADLITRQIAKDQT
jgi:hypothetical protein